MTSRRTFLMSTLPLVPAVSLGLIPRRALAAKYSFKFGSSLPYSHPTCVTLRAALEKIKQETNGELEITLYSDGQLGGDSAMLPQVRSGALEFYLTAGVLITALVPAAGIINVPFAFKDYSTVWKAMDADLGKDVAASIGKANLHVFDTLWDNGFRQITSGNRPIATPQDLQGFKIRVPSSPINVALFQALGAAPTVLNANDAYTALQTHVVDGQENPLVTIVAYKFFEAQKYCAMSNHLWDGVIAVANPKVWGTLPKELQEIITRNLAQGARKQREEIQKADAGARTLLESKGIQFNSVDTASFQTVLKKAKFYATWKEKFGNDAWRQLERYAGPLT